MNVRRLPAHYGWRWLVTGFQLFRRSPLQWLLLVGALFAASRLVFLIPFAALFVALLVPHFVAGLAHGAQALDHGKPLRAGYLISGFLRNAGPLVTIGGVSLMGQLLTLIAITAVGGEAFAEVARALAQGGATPENAGVLRAAVPRMTLAMLTGFAVSLPVMMATWFAPLLVFFDDLKAAAALRLSLLACLYNARPLLLFGVLLTIPLFVFTRIGLVLRQADLGVWLLAPVLLPALYASYRDLFVQEPPPH